MTQRPLLDLIPDILQHISKHQETLEYNLRLYRIVEGQIRKEIEDSMRQEILSPAALRRALKRVPSINIPKKANDKLSKVYAEPVTRLAPNSSDQNLMDSIVKISGFNATMMSANKMWNLTKMAAIEPFIENRQQKFRILAGHQFLPFSDDPVNPMRMTVFIKLLDKVEKATDDTRQYIHTDGLLVTDDSEIKRVHLFQLFTDKEIIIIDSDGSVRLDKMAQFGLNGSNPIGMIPQIYLNKSQHELVPFPDTADIDVGVLIPKLLSDLNYAVQFQSHSMIWTKNADLGNQEAHPDTILDLGDSNAEGGGDPEIGTIDPKVDIEGVLNLVEFQMAGYFSSKGIKTASMKHMMPGREASGIAKAMDEGDVSAELKVQTEYFRQIEHDFWSKMTKLQAYWSSINAVDEKRKFSNKFAEDFSIIYKPLRVIESTQEKTLKVQAQKDLGIIDKRSMVKEFNPEFSEAEIEDRLAKAKEEKEEMMKEFMNGTTAPNGFDTNPEGPESAAEGSASGGNNQSDQE